MRHDINFNGIVLWEGPSELDGGPIVLIATGFKRASKNTKTGDMIQTWILRSDMPPGEALDGADKSICGDCPKRRQPDGSRECYVNVMRGPLAVYRCYKSGRYPRLKNDGKTILGLLHRLRSLFSDRAVRFGAYGDPAAVPAIWWSALRNLSASVTGYTHQAAGLSHLMMMSVDTPEQATDAQALGLRYFRTGDVGEQPGPGEIMCPASEEAGYKSNCAKCRLCDGTRLAGDKRRNIFIVNHSPKARAAKRRLNVLQEVAA